MFLKNNLGHFTAHEILGYAYTTIKQQKDFLNRHLLQQLVEKAGPICPVDFKQHEDLD